MQYFVHDDTQSSCDVVFKRDYENVGKQAPMTTDGLTDVTRVCSDSGICPAVTHSMRPASGDIYCAGAVCTGDEVMVCCDVRTGPRPDGDRKGYIPPREARELVSAM